MASRRSGVRLLPTAGTRAGSRSELWRERRVLANKTRERDGRSSFDPNFRRLLAAESEKDLAKWIVPIVKRARNAKDGPVPVYYEELLTALLHTGMPLIAPAASASAFVGLRATGSPPPLRQKRKSSYELPHPSISGLRERGDAPHP